MCIKDLVIYDAKIQPDKHTRFHWNTYSSKPWMIFNTKCMTLSLKSSDPQSVTIFLWHLTHSEKSNTKKADFKNHFLTKRCPIILVSGSAIHRSLWKASLGLIFQLCGPYTHCCIRSCARNVQEIYISDPLTLCQFCHHRFRKKTVPCPTPLHLMKLTVATRVEEQ